MPTAKETYERTDKTIEALNKSSIKRFNSARSKSNLLRFDELNAIKAIKQLYTELASDNEQAFLTLAKQEYTHNKTIWALEGKSEQPTKKWLIAFLAAYNPVTKYVYTNEVERKRDYTIEAVIASRSKAGEFRRGLSYWVQFTAQAAEDVTDAATLKSYADSGIEYVRWKTQEDGKVCDVCKERNGKVYRIDKIPPKPHRRCRCHFEPVEK